MKHLPITLLRLVVLMFPLAASASPVLYSLHGSANTNLVQYSGETLQPLGSPASNSAYSHFDLAIDEGGRLFGIGIDSLIEFDRTSGAAIKSQLFTGSINGIAAHAGVLYSLTGGNQLVRYDFDTLLPLGLAASSSADFNSDLAFDETGRLFGMSNSALFELDPTTGAILHSVDLTGSVKGLAARNGLVYTLTGPDNSLFSYNADTLLPVAGSAQNNAWSTDDLAFDNTGRLFAIGSNKFLEFDPSTGALLNSTTWTGSINGLAAWDEPARVPDIASTLSAFSLGLLTLAVAKRINPAA